MVNKSQLLAQLHAEAVSKYGDNIQPIPHRGSFDNCITIIDNKLVFWFNTQDGSTHIISLSLPISGALKCLKN